MAAPRFLPLGILNTENIEEYRPGGYHPISIGDVFDHGRFRVLHKLGCGGSSTVWLARDQREGKDQGRIVALKALRADICSESPNEIPEVDIPQQLRASLPLSCSVSHTDTHTHTLSLRVLSLRLSTSSLYSLIRFPSVQELT